jgi:hypothetical protein
MTAGRDWMYQILRICLPTQIVGMLPYDSVDASLEGVSMQIVHRTPLNRGWLEGVHAAPSSLT